MIKISKRHSLTRIIVYYLILIGSIIAILTTMVSYSFLSHRSKVQYELKLEEYLAYLKDSLELPVWRMDRSSFEKICMAFFENEEVGLIQVSDENGILIFETGSFSVSDLIKGDVNLHHKNEIIGQVVLGLIPSAYKQKNKELLIASIFMAAMMILGLTISTRIVLNTLLKKPLDDLILQIQKIAMGLSFSLSVVEFNIVS